MSGFLLPQFQGMSSLSISSFQLILLFCARLGTKALSIEAEGRKTLLIFVKFTEIQSTSYFSCQIAQQGERRVWFRNFTHVPNISDEDRDLAYSDVFSKYVFANGISDSSRCSKQHQSYPFFPETIEV